MIIGVNIANRCCVYREPSIICVFDGHCNIGIFHLFRHFCSISFYSSFIGIIVRTPYKNSILAFVKFINATFYPTIYYVIRTETMIKRFVLIHSKFPTIPYVGTTMILEVYNNLLAFRNSHSLIITAPWG